MEDLYFFENDDEFISKLKGELKGVFLKGEKIAIKLHMGEPKNENRLKAEFVRKIVDVLKELGCEPFLFDSLVLYKSERDSIEGYQRVAEKNGFGKLGCPVIVSDDSVTSTVNNIDFPVCKSLAEADGVLVLTHVKGHQCSGFGAAIKNLGMGALTKEGKKIVHDAGKPKYVGGCTMCGECAKNCNINKNIRYENNRPIFGDNCNGCSVCSYVCKEGAIKPNIELFDRVLAWSAGAVLKKFKKTYFVNVLRNIAELCDCYNSTPKIVLGDIGIVMGKDIVAIEKASHDLIVKGAGKDIFAEIHHKSPMIQIEEAEKIGIGKMDYKLL